MTDTVTITIDGQDFEVPKGMNLVDAAKLHGIGIPVFCYHPKLDPVGMCRMCLVELGNVAIDRTTGAPELDEQGNPVIRWFPKLQTACTQTVSQGMVLRTTSDMVVEGRENILEFLLTSHPLDCPVCDKGGECPLQNLTMAYGPGESRFIYDDKIRLAKHVPLGKLIYLDRERCIQCARCTRFCDEIVGDDVLAFHERGRRLQIVTISDPPFDTKFSGNTTDICPVGALTTTDFRFGARPWELTEVSTICPYCPVGCNLNASTRMDREFGGKAMIKRIMPRQNERVNEIWICDKGRFGHHHSRHEERLLAPLMRNKSGELVEVEWPAVYKAIAKQLKAHGDQAGFVGDSTLSNEDLWELRRLAELSGGSPRLGLWPATMSGGDVVAQVGVGSETRLQDLGPGSVILVMASDFEEEAPIWWLQVKQAADRGAKVVVANARPTKLDRYASAVIHYRYDEAVGVLNSFTAPLLSGDGQLGQGNGWGALQSDLQNAEVTHADTANLLASAENLVIFLGSEGLTLEQHAELMQAAANLLIVSGHVGRPNNGLIPVWPGANVQGAWDMGFSAEATADLLANPPALWVIGGADVAGEDIRMATALEQAEFVVVTAQFMTPTAAHADIVLPRQSFAERAGTYTNGLRRVQRFYPAQGPIGDALPDWKIFAHVSAQMGGPRPPVAAGTIFRDIAQRVERYIGMDYTRLAWFEPQFPDVGGDDLYYGGTAYSNYGGLGLQWPAEAEAEQPQFSVRPVRTAAPQTDGLTLVPVWVLFDRGHLFEKSELMHHRMPQPYAAFNPDDAARLGLTDGDRVTLAVEGHELTVTAQVGDDNPAGAVLLPRRLSGDATLSTPAACTVQKIESMQKVEG
ncbi:MAG: NADH-quinone oxidoreductase subunit NuoG [Chloroflexi bacterium]|nr:NADH-quinone oxidoreductase subunit NuoG [Chloroflexota bacterium]